MEIGALRHRITIQKSTETANVEGEPIAAWATFAAVWASIEPLSGREQEAARQTYGEVSHRIRIRYRAGVLPKMRIIKGWIDAAGEPGAGARLFQVEGVLNLEERNREMHIFCTEQV